MELYYYCCYSQKLKVYKIKMGLYIWLQYVRTQIYLYIYIYMYKQDCDELLSYLKCFYIVDVE